MEKINVFVYLVGEVYNTLPYVIVIGIGDVEEVYSSKLKILYFLYDIITKESNMLDLIILYD